MFSVRESTKINGRKRILIIFTTILVTLIAAITLLGTIPMTDASFESALATASEEFPKHEQDPDFYSEIAPNDPNDPGRTYFAASATKSFDSDVAEERFHEYINELRAEEGLEPLAYDDTIASVSRAHSLDMYERDFFSHDNPDGDGAFDRYQDVSDNCNGFGENLQWHSLRTSFEDGEDVAEFAAESLMDSPPHQKNILRDGWDSQGVGIYLTNDGRAFVTQKFCTRKDVDVIDTAPHDLPVSAIPEPLPWVEIWEALDPSIDSNAPVSEDELKPAIVEVVDGFNEPWETGGHLDRAIDVGYLLRTEDGLLMINHQRIEDWYSEHTTQSPTPTPTSQSPNTTPTEIQTTTQTPIITENGRSESEGPGFSAPSVVLSLLLALLILRRRFKP